MFPQNNNLKLRLPWRILLVFTLALLGLLSLQLVLPVPHVAASSQILPPPATESKLTQNDFIVNSLSLQRLDLPPQLEHLERGEMLGKLEDLAKREERERGKRGSFRKELAALDQAALPYLNLLVVEEGNFMWDWGLLPQDGHNLGYAAGPFSWTGGTEAYHSLKNLASPQGRLLALVDAGDCYLSLSMERELQSFQVNILPKPWGEKPRRLKIGALPDNPLLLPLLLSRGEEIYLVYVEDAEDTAYLHIESWENENFSEIYVGHFDYLKAGAKPSTRRLFALKDDGGDELFCFLSYNEEADYSVLHVLAEGTVDSYDLDKVYNAVYSSGEHILLLRTDLENTDGRPEKVARIYSSTGEALGPDQPFAWPIRQMKSLGGGLLLVIEDPPDKAPLRILSIEEGEEPQFLRDLGNLSGYTQILQDSESGDFYLSVSRYRAGASEHALYVLKGDYN